MALSAFFTSSGFLVESTLGKLYRERFRSHIGLGKSHTSKEDKCYKPVH